MNLQQALDQLGKDPDTIYRTLVSLGIRGGIMNPSFCPVEVMYHLYRSFSICVGNHTSQGLARALLLRAQASARMGKDEAQPYDRQSLPTVKNLSHCVRTSLRTWTLLQARSIG